MTDPSPSDYVVKVTLTEEEIKAADTVLDEMLQADFFNTLSYDCFLLLEKLMGAIRAEVAVKKQNKLIADRLDNMKDWVNERCITCKHVGNDHALGGTGLCIRESCACMKFLGKK